MQAALGCCSVLFTIGNAFSVHYWCRLPFTCCMLPFNVAGYLSILLSAFHHWHPLHASAAQAALHLLHNACHCCILPCSAADEHTRLTVSFTLDRKTPQTSQQHHQQVNMRKQHGKVSGKT